MRSLSLFRTDLPYGLAIIRLTALAVVPSLALASLAWFLLSSLGVDVTADAETISGSWRPESPTFLIAAVIVFPFIETLFLIGGLWLLGLLVKSPWVSSWLSGIAWGVLHGTVAPLWFVGTFWSFVVFSGGYLSWRKVGRLRGFGAAWLPHALTNGIAMSLLLVSADA